MEIVLVKCNDNYQNHSNTIGLDNNSLTPINTENNVPPAHMAQ